MKINVIQAISMQPFTSVTPWLTGLPAANKTTLARLPTEYLRRQGRSIELLDGDERQKTLTKDFGCSREDPLENIRRIALVAAGVSWTGGIAVVPAITPSADARAQARRTIGCDVEIYARCLSACSATRKGFIPRRNEVKSSGLSVCLPPMKSRHIST